MSIRIRKAKVEDASQLAELWHEMASFHARQGEYWSIKRGCKRGFHDHIGKVIAEGKSGVFVAHDSGNIVGFVVTNHSSRARIFVQRDHGLIGDLAVTKTYRRRGIGEKLCHRALQWIRSQGFSVAEVRVSTQNPVAIAFWEKMGFEQYMALVKKEV